LAYLIAGNAEPVLVLLQDVLKLNGGFIVKSETVEYKVAGGVHEVFHLVVGTLPQL
jgi:hypothetical protein